MRRPSRDFANTFGVADIPGRRPGLGFTNAFGVGEPSLLFESQNVTVV
jgi:hypothetical protein